MPADLDGIVANKRSARVKSNVPLAAMVEKGERQMSQGTDGKARQEERLCERVL